ASGRPACSYSPPLANSRSTSPSTSMSAASTLLVHSAVRPIAAMVTSCHAPVKSCTWEGAAADVGEGGRLSGVSLDEGDPVQPTKKQHAVRTAGTRARMGHPLRGYEETSPETASWFPWPANRPRGWG